MNKAILKAADKIASQKWIPKWIREKVLSVAKAFTDFIDSVFEKTTKKVVTGTDTVWDNIKITQPMYDNTKIPQSFELMANGENFWVHPNGTKHMAEYITRNPVSHGMPINSQTLLSSFQSSVSRAVEQGIKYDEIMNIGNWELIFSKSRGEGLLPVIKHAMYKP